MDQKKLFVGNLSFNVSGEDLHKMFSEFGEITDATLILDRASGRSKGFGFVTFANEEDAAKAAEEMNGKEYDNRSLTVNVAKPQERR